MTPPPRSSDGDAGDGDRVFVLRFWRERPAAGGAAAMWRAKVTEPDGGPTRHADGVEQALAIVREAMAVASPGPVAPPA